MCAIVYEEISKNKNVCTYVFKYRKKGKISQLKKRFSFPLFKSLKKIKKYLHKIFVKYTEADANLKKI